MKKSSFYLTIFTLTFLLSGCSAQETDGTFYNIFVKPIDIFISKVYSLIGNWGITLIVVTLIIRGIILPFVLNNYKTMQKNSINMRRASPELSKVQNDIKNLQQQEKITPNKEEKIKIRSELMNKQREIMAIYKKYDCNPMSGLKNILPMLIQAPFLTGIYFVLQNPIYSSGLKNASFLGLNLGEKSIIVIVVVFIIYTFVGKVSLSMNQNQTMMNGGMSEESAKTMESVPKTMMWLTPIMISFMTYSNISAIGIYFIVGGLVALMQTIIGKKLYPISKEQPIKQNETNKVKLVKKKK